MQVERREVTPQEERFARFSALIGLGLIIIFAAVFFIWRPYSLPGPMMRDLEAYYAAGATWAAGGDPYSTQIWSTERTIPGVDAERYEVLPFLGPPVSLPLWALLARLPFNAAGIVWSIVLALAAIAIFLGSFALARRPRSWWDLPIVVALAAAFSPLASGFSLGQAAIAAMGAIVVALCAMRERRASWAGIASFVAVALKPNVGLALLGLLRSRRGIAAALCAGVAFLVANAALVGVRGLIHYEMTLRGQTEAERWSILQFTPASIAFGFGASGSLAIAMGMVVALVALVILVTVVFVTKARSVETAALACASVPFVSPFLHLHDLIVTFLPAMLVIHWARGRVWVAGAVGTVMIATNWIAMTQGKIGGAYAYITAVAVSLEIAALARGIDWRIRLTPFVVTVFVAPLWMAVPFRPTPLWPDALPQGFRPALTQPVSAVWAAEQVAAGLERRDAFAAFLRSLSLAGCALVFTSLGITVAARARSSPDGRPSNVVAEMRPKRGQRKPRVAAHVDG